MIYIGIDPGYSGAVSFLDDNGKVFMSHPLKDHTDKDIDDVFRVLFEMVDVPKYAVIESVHSMPKQGVSSSFKFGLIFGLLRMALIAYRIPHEFASPQSWMKFMGCMTHGDKNVSKAAAQRLFPETKITHANADSLLLAEYCRRIVRMREGRGIDNSKQIC